MASDAPHLVLLGDSILDNAAYTSGGPDVATHLRHLLPTGWRVTLLAEDGATVAHVEHQLAYVPADATHLLVSMGGNDALQHADLLTLRTASSREAYEAAARRLGPFEVSYRRVLARAQALRRWTGVCTIYNGWLDPSQVVAARVGVTLFNDVILRAATTAGVDVLELRAICTEAADYANPIEPSDAGGLKIARGVARMVGALPAARPVARVWGGEP